MKLTTQLHLYTPYMPPTLSFTHTLSLSLSLSLKYSLEQNVRSHSHNTWKKFGSTHSVLQYGSLQEKCGEDENYSLKQSARSHKKIGQAQIF